MKLNQVFLIAYCPNITLLTALIHVNSTLYNAFNRSVHNGFADKTGPLFSPTPIDK